VQHEMSCEAPHQRIWRTLQHQYVDGFITSGYQLHAHWMQDLTNSNCFLPQVTSVYTLFWSQLHVNKIK
jgi:hypothetical protein